MRKQLLVIVVVFVVGALVGGWLLPMQRTEPIQQVEPVAVDPKVEPVPVEPIPAELAEQIARSALTTAEPTELTLRSWRTTAEQADPIAKSIFSTMATRSRVLEGAYAFTASVSKPLEPTRDLQLSLVEIEGLVQHLSGAMGQPEAVDIARGLEVALREATGFAGQLEVVLGEPADFAEELSQILIGVIGSQWQPEDRESIQQRRDLKRLLYLTEEIAETITRLTQLHFDIGVTLAGMFAAVPALDWSTMLWLGAQLAEQEAELQRQWDRHRKLVEELDQVEQRLQAAAR